MLSKASSVRAQGTLKKFGYDILVVCIILNIYLKIYFSDGWNTFDFIIVVGSFIDIAFSDDSVSASFVST